ncbi:ABC transporter ATP-binding protein [Goodfellowiella coeruleoviolacea]|uniref:ABC transport system ATP-binding protein n=1 Tax=Goodfellowiella coeruleoviolacea TaxID=334858 RepID=A0AAE3KIL6_9PSEU|nr:ABC transporter ATP-binding protein [Goodfellowiella coeruleoviolacea]MCP2167524.1 putative ABC transport system ATP-binding protein [Goodfellowiella coeruleoviolacea]
MSATGETALRGQGLYRSFQHPAGPVSVLRGAEVRIAAGEFVTLTAPSGAGKSALLAVLCGFDQPDAGTVEIAGRPVTRPPAWRDCAVLPQSLGLAQELTLAENIALPLRLAPRDRSLPDQDTPDAAVAALLAELDLDGLADRYPHEVSYGQQQRAALARAVIARPRVLLADEPTAHLDQRSAPLVLALLRRRADQGGAVLVASHHEEVHQAADRTLVLDQGRVHDAPTA